MVKVLFITYYWPPAGGSGVQRVLKFVKYLPEFDIQPIVLTVKDGDYPAVDESLVADVPNGVPVYRVKGWEPYKLYRRFTGISPKESIPVATLAENTGQSLRHFLANWIRLNLFIPDGRRLLVRPLLRKAVSLIEREKIEVIFTSSPPHSIQLVGLELKKRTGLPWIGDFRDPWLSIDYYQKTRRMEFAKNRDSAHEKKVVNSLNLLVAPSSSILIDFQSKYEPTKTCLIHNGFDEQDCLGHLNFHRPSAKDFIILHYGTLGEDRIVPEVVEAFSQCVPHAATKSRRLIAKFIGHVNKKLKTLFFDASLNDHAVFVDYLPHKELMKEAASSSILLLIINRVPNNKGILPGKLFEYLAFGIPILGLGPIDGEAARILAETGNKMVPYRDIDSMTHFILSVLCRPKKPGSSLIQIEKYTRRSQSKELSEQINSLLLPP